MWNDFFFRSVEEIDETPSTSMYRDSSKSFRKNLYFDKIATPKTPPRILLVDDDPTFLRIMKRAAEKKRAEITSCQSLEEFGALKSWDFDVVVMDYDLGAVTRFELTAYIEQFTKEEVPVVLVSQTKRNDSKVWPSTIREFVHKSLGPFAILDATFEAYEVARIHREMRKHSAIH